ncbi:hypothetical protein BESB_023300 [Besnoitia besnoiti]|uniref:MIP18 family-like domain-containing protein n=1 Tax=Besnoitia besnoiti TaxID=94643 RepID=A0A2A9LZM4_BESBE|nr:hypothetical protein BESB_023300 [Besnoitia besnoiti]PFH31838.1 hypothetical protein BESB_023300 [Besnoitia besnoiti]
MWIPEKRTGLLEEVSAHLDGAETCSSALTSSAPEASSAKTGASGACGGAPPRPARAIFPPEASPAGWNPGDSLAERARRTEESQEERRALAALSPFAQEIFFAARAVRDPEFPAYTLGDLGVVTPSLVRVENEETLSLRPREASDFAAEGCDRAAGAAEPLAGKGEDRISVSRAAAGAAASASSCAALVRGGGLGMEGRGGEGGGAAAVVTVGFTPTNARCSMASLIGLALRCKLCERFNFISPNCARFSRGAPPEPRTEDEPDDDVAPARRRREEREAAEPEGVNVQTGLERGLATRAGRPAEAAEGQVCRRERQGEPRGRVSSSCSEPRRRRLILDLQVLGHEDEAGLSRQLNDKERVCAALENPHIRELVIAAIQEDEA